MTSETRKMLDERLSEIEAEQKGTGKCYGNKQCSHDRLFLYSVQFTFDNGKKGTTYGPALPVAHCCQLSAHKMVFNEMWEIAEASLGHRMTGACIRFDQELHRETVDEVLGL